MSQPPNPFDRFELDPSSDLAAITDALRERTESAEPDERASLRVAWEALALHPRRRLELALTAVPETRSPLGAAPARAALAASARERDSLSLLDLVGLAPLERTLPTRDEGERALLAPRRIVAPK